MKMNVGGVDKAIRIIAGIAIIALGIYLKSWWGLIGVPVLATGLLNFCALYVPLHISTRKPTPQ